MQSSHDQSPEDRNPASLAADSGSPSPGEDNPSTALGPEGSPGSTDDTDSAAPAQPDLPTSETPTSEDATQASREQASEPEGAHVSEAATSAIVSSVKVPGTGDDPETSASDGEATPRQDLHDLIDKLLTWWKEARVGERLSLARKPAQLVIGAIVLLFVLRLYSAAVNLIESLPIISGLLELVGLVAVVRFSATRLLRQADREQVRDEITARWRSYLGTGVGE